MSRTAGLKKLSAISARDTRETLIRGPLPVMLPSFGGRRRCVLRARALNVEGHQDRVHVAVLAAVMRLAVPLAAESVPLVQRDRSLVMGEDVQLELADAGLARPCHGCVEKGTPD